MAKLILSMDGLVLKEIPLVKERLTIGRKSHNDIQIDNLAISGDHAAIVNILNDSFLEDLNSTNGTLVNGQPIKKHFLRHGDVIELSKYKLKYMNDPQGNGASVEIEDPLVPMASPPAASIQLLNGPNAGKALRLTKTLTSLGKPGVQVAVIARRTQGYFITHVEGNLFPLVNGLAINAQAHLLTDHDVIELAGIKMEFFLGT
jgi:hypothetical protein